MTGGDRPAVLGEVAALLGAEPAWASLVTPDAALLVVAGDGAVMAVSEAARAAIGDGSIDPASSAGRRLLALAAGAAPRAKPRLERLALGRDPTAPPLICACRLVRLADGTEVLAVVILGRALAQGEEAASSPGKRPLGAATVVMGSEGEGAPPGDPAPTAPDAEDADRSRAPVMREGVRLLWETDRQGRFVAVSPSLAALVGETGAAILGRTWEEIIGPLVGDPGGELAALLARGETFSARRVLWRLEDGRRALPVDLGGRPLAPGEEGGRPRAYRGFGLARTGAIADHPWPPLPGAEPAAPADPAPAAPLQDWSGLFTALEGWTMALLGAPRPAPPRPGGPEPEGVGAEASEPPRAKLLPTPAGEDAPPAEARPAPHLSHAERHAFREIARALGARFEGDGPEPEAPSPPAPAGPALPPPSPEAGERAGTTPEPAAAATKADPDRTARFLDRLPVGVLVHRGDAPLYANRAALDLVGYASLGDLAAAGGVGALFPGGSALEGREPGAAVALRTGEGRTEAADIRLTSAEWESEPASVLVLRRATEASLAARARAAEEEVRARDARLGELSAILDTAADGIVLLDEAGRILSLNRSAEALFGYDQNEVVGEPFTVLLAAESRQSALDYLAGLRANGVASVLNDGRDVVGRVAQGGTIPLTLALGQVSEDVSGEAEEGGQGAGSAGRRFCAVLRDVTAARGAEAELAAAKRAAEAALESRADFLGRVSHEVRTPLNAIIGFAEIMLDERAAQAGAERLAERHGDYLRDIQESGRQLMRVVNDLVDLARIEAGRMELAFTGIGLSGLVAEAVAALQAEAAERRVVIRTALASKLPPVVADARSVRQIVHHVAANAIRYTEPGGQVIVSTALTDRGEVVFRARDTGVGMTAQEIEAALEPFRTITTARRGRGSGLGLPLTRALVQANRGLLHITSAKGQGTFVEVVFPANRVLVE